MLFRGHKREFQIPQVFPIVEVTYYPRFLTLHAEIVCTWALKINVIRLRVKVSSIALQAQDIASELICTVCM